MKGKKRFDKKKGLLYYLLIMLTINFIFNGYLKQKFIQNVSYSEFVKLGEEGKIVSVEVDNDEIIFEVKSENKKSGKLYKANNMKDPELVGKLEEWGVEEYTARSQKVSIAQYLLTSWVIPIIIIMMIWNFISRSISKRMGGNVMNFGEKVGTIYAENEAN
ncbi:ATP-dependent metallopeptidase FtsH/Yme1/Tma family protein, partial [Bacteroidales bacterium MSK.15.36]|nr:ATP-dependent metallopeptidase FtsH/Yme1/Tma family protein [Bacteroidales bacterium MSK.15.36]